MMMWMLLSLLACEQLGEDADGTTGNVECRGMTHQNLVWRTARSALLSYDAENDISVPRCQLMLSRDLTGGDIQMNSGNALDLDTLPDSGTGWIYADGTNWIIDSGTMSFDTYDNTLGIGTYSFDVAAISVDNARTGRTATFDGEFSWCEGRRDDCPFRFESGLTKSAMIDTPVMLEREAGLTECRMVVDPATEAVQVDFQIGTWDGDNVAQLWTNECGAFGLIPPQNNLFTFQAGGVTGPGSYGPQTSVILDGGQRLPMLHFEHPATFYGGVNQVQACNFLYFNQASVDAVDGTTCSFTIDADSDRFTLDCDGAYHSGASTWPDTAGEFSFDGDCEYVER